MSYTAQELLKLASDYDNVATRALVVTAEKKEKKKLDPKAKVRNRGTVCVSAEQAKDKKDHFPINDEGQARNALARVQQLTSAPWYKGSLEGLKALVARKVKAKYPKINVGGKDSKKKASEYYDTLLQKFAQVKDQAYADNLTKSHIQSIQAINVKQWSPEQVIQQANDHTMQAQREFDSKLITQEQYQQIVQAVQTKGNEAQAARQTATAPNTPAATTPAKPPTPAAPAKRPGIPYKKEVEIAQQQLANLGGYDLGQSGKYGNGVDGQLGKKTIEALKKYNPHVPPEEAIKILVQEYNAGVGTVPKPEPTPLPAPSTGPQLDRSDPWATPAAPKTWGGT